MNVSSPCIRNPSPRIRGPNLAVFTKFEGKFAKCTGVLMEEALRRTDEAGLVIASSKRLSKALVENETVAGFVYPFGCWSGTMTGYDEPGKKLGKYIEYPGSLTGMTYVFPVPDEHQGKKNILLAVNHPDFSLEKDGKYRVVQATRVDAIDAFPTICNYGIGPYAGDPKYDIPQGKKLNTSNSAARELYRLEKRVGLIVRIVGGSAEIHIDFGLSHQLGVIVEAPGVVTPENQDKR